MEEAIEVARFRVDPSAEEALLEAWPAMVDAMRRANPSLREVTLVQFDDGTWADIAIWEDRASASAACELGPRLPEVEAWFAHIEEDLGLDLARPVRRR